MEQHTTAPAKETWAAAVTWEGFDLSRVYDVELYEWNLSYVRKAAYLTVAAYSSYFTGSL